MDRMLSKDSISGGLPVVKKPMMENAPQDLASKKKELTEAMKRDMERRSTEAKGEIEAVCKKYRVDIVSMPNLTHLANGTYGIVGQTVIKALE
jgi:hypothetical protein